MTFEVRSDIGSEDTKCDGHGSALMGALYTLSSAVREIFLNVPETNLGFRVDICVIFTYFKLS